MASHLQSALLVSCLVYLSLDACFSESLKFQSAAYQYPFQNPSLSWEARVDDLAGRLTLDEIVPQTLAVYGSHTPAIPRLGIKPYVWITECVRGEVGTNTTAFPHSIGLAASFRSVFSGRINKNGIMVKM